MEQRTEQDVSPYRVFSRAEFGLDLCKRDAANVQHDEQVIKKVSRFADHALAILADRRNRRLDSLLAELFRAMRHTAVEELARIGDFRARLRAVPHAFLEVLQGERHGTFLVAAFLSTSARRIL